MSNIYLTHCSNKKDESLKTSRKKVTPDKLYTGVRIQRFMKRCKEARVKWAIFSDKYNIWFEKQKHGYYNKHPKDVKPEEFKVLVKNSIKKLKKYDRVYFYANHKSHYCHPLYIRLINNLRKHRIDIIKICHLDQIINQ